MRFLFVTPFVPDPAAGHGGGVYLGALLPAMARHGDLGLCALTTDANPHEALQTAPLQWVRVIENLGHSAGPGTRLRRLWQWRHRPLVALKAWQPALRNALQTALDEFQPDVVFVEMAQMAQYLPWLRQVPTVLTDHEAGCPANTRTGLGAWGDRRDVALWQRYIGEFFPQAKALQAVTADDAAALSARLHREVLVRPPTVEVAATAAAPGQAPPRALFLGDYRHAPNPEAAARLAAEVLPLIRRRVPDAELWLAGANDTAIQPLAGVPGVRVLGFVPDLRQLFAQVRVLLAPLWSGSGFRVKVMSALAHGIPVVSNTLGARGCSAPAPALTIAATDGALVDHAVALLADSALAAKAGRCAHEWARQTLSPARVAAQQAELAARLCSASAL